MKRAVKNLQIWPYDMQRLPLREVKNQGKFQIFSYKSDRGRLREVVAYKRFQI